jgi:hypothetical protein
MSGDGGRGLSSRYELAGEGDSATTLATQKVVRSVSEVLEPVGSQERKALGSIKKQTPMVKSVPDLSESLDTVILGSAYQTIVMTLWLFSTLRREKRSFHDWCSIILKQGKESDFLCISLAEQKHVLRGSY